MITTIVFDLGAVLIDWHPKHLYRKIFRTEEEIDFFLENICTSAWNEEQDGGRSLREATEVLVQQFPEQKENIRAYYGRWEEMLAGPVEGTVEIFKRLKEKKRYKFYALTNWSAETFPIARQRFDFLGWFDGIVMSGEERLRKPFPEFYQLLTSRYEVKPHEALFIDDNLRNVEAAEKLGFQCIHFISAEQLNNELKKRGID